MVKNIDMEKRFYPIEYKGKTVYCSDWTNLDEAKEITNVIEYTTSKVVEMDTYGLLEIVDISKSYAIREGMRAARTSAQTTDKYSKKKALIGLNSKAKQVLFNFVNQVLGKKMVVFETKEEALEWLVKDD